MNGAKAEFANMITNPTINKRINSGNNHHFFLAFKYLNNSFRNSIVTF